MDGKERGKGGSGSEHKGRDEGKTEGKQGGFRVPPAMMLPVGAAVGWLMADWVGAIFGGVIGLFLWRSRA